VRTVRAGAAPINRLVTTCCPIAQRLLTVQYNTSPLGAQMNIVMKMSGMNSMIFCCCGSPDAGVIFVCTNCVAPIRTGVTNHGS
jgi:hypothetical protein